MSSLGKVLRFAVPAVAASAGAYLITTSDEGNLLPLRRMFSKSTTSTVEFDEHFPRGVWNKNWDFRDPHLMYDKEKHAKASDDEKKNIEGGATPTATRNIFLIRHGQYQMDTSDKALTPLGREQAELIGRRLAESGIKFDKVVMSTMTRATETANIILKHLPESVPRSSTAIIEEGPPYPPVPDVSHWRPQSSTEPDANKQVEYPEWIVEEFFAEGARIESAFRKIFHRADASQKEDSYELYVCHANVIRFFVCRALQFPPEGWLRFSLGNCSLTWVVIRPSGRVSVRSMGDIGHVPPSKITFS